MPDGGIFAPDQTRCTSPPPSSWVEIVSPGDESWEKLDFYAAHGVDELLIVDPQERRVDWLGLQPSGEYRPTGRSRLIALGPAQLAEQIDWPD